MTEIRREHAWSLETGEIRHSVSAGLAAANASDFLIKSFLGNIIKLLIDRKQGS